MHVRRLPALLAKYCRWKIFHCVQLLSWHVELLDGEILYTLREAQIVIESWRRHFNTISPHKSLGCKPLAHECSCQQPLRGRLRYVARLRRPRSHWHNGQH
jgi:hypothetical protein